MIDINNDELVKMKVDSFSLKFRDDVVETDYRYEHSAIIYNSFLLYFFSQLIFWIVDLSLESSENLFEQDKISKILKIILIVISLLSFWKPIRINFPTFYKYYYGLSIIVDIIILYIEKANNDTKLCYLFIITFSFPSIISVFYFQTIIFGIIIYLLGSIPAIFLYNSDFLSWTYQDSAVNQQLNNKTDTCNIYTNHSDNSSSEDSVSILPLLYHKSLLILGNFLALIFYGYYEEFFTRINFLKFYKKNNDMKKNNEIYSNLVPEFVREKMKNGIRGAAIDYEIVTILFCDISDFDKFVASMSPKDLIQLLDRIYNNFDQLCNLHGLQKIETVGKTYMAAAGLKESEKDVDPFLLKKHQAIRAFEVALDMIDTVEKIILENGETVKIKVGLHTGKVIAAVVGNHKPQFSLIGDAINTTARMCAYSSDMCILCSEPAWEGINKEYTDFTQSVKEIKGKGVMNIYLFNPNKPKIENENFMNNMNKEKKKLGETKFINNLNFNFNLNNVGGNNNPNRKNFLRKQTLSINKDNNYNFNNANSLINNNLINNKKAKNFQRQSSVYSNNSNFIFENSLDNIEENNENRIIPQTKRSKTKPKSLSRLVTHKEQETSHQLNNENDIVEKNYIWNKSFLFLKFYDQQSENLFAQFSKYKFLKSINRAIVFNYCYCVIMLIATYNIGEYNWLACHNVHFVFTILKIFLIVNIILFSHMSSNFVSDENNKNYIMKLIIWILYLFMTILILFEMNNVINDNFILNLSIEQIFTTLIISFNGFLSYWGIFYNLVLYVIFFVINAIVNRGSLLMIKYNIFMILISLIIYCFILFRYYISTLNYLKNLSESENLKKIENLLFNLMPQHVVLNLKEDIPVADVLEDVTMLFAGKIILLTIKYKLNFSLCN